MEILDPYIYPDDSDVGFGGTGQFLFEDNGREENRSVTASKAALLRRFIGEVKEKLDIMEKLLIDTSNLNGEDVERLLLKTPIQKEEKTYTVEGIFNGEHMMGTDGKQYTVTSNYASKSKLVEGDILKLAIRDDGTFVYKQIGPVERQRIIGKLAQDELTGEYVAIGDGKKWSVLLASVTYFKAEPGDDMVILVPKNAPSRWAAVENIIKPKQEPSLDN